MDDPGRTGSPEGEPEMTKQVRRLSQILLAGMLAGAVVAMQVVPALAGGRIP